MSLTAFFLPIKSIEKRWEGGSSEGLKYDFSQYYSINNERWKILFILEKFSKENCKVFFIITVIFIIIIDCKIVITYNL